MIQVDFRRIIIWLLPVDPRTTIEVSWLQALFAPLRTLYTLFNGRRVTNLYTLSITPQVCYLEKMLNDRYDDTERRIYITDGERVPDVYIYLEDEQKPLYIYLDSEASPVYIYTKAERETGESDFVVHVPSTIIYNDNEMRALLDSYKLASKRYNIVTF